MIASTSASPGKQSGVLIGYDGSEEARRAIAFAGAIFPGRHAIVLHIFTLSVAPAAVGVTGEDLELLTSSIEQHAKDVAEEGAELAKAAGLKATPTVIDAVGASATWSTIVRVAQEQDVELIVVGSRGRSGLKAALLGSVSNGVLHHADRPVLVVPHAKE